MTLESTTTGHFPPSSKVTGVRCFAAAAITMRPTLGLPAQIEELFDKIILALLRIKLDALLYVFGRLERT